MSALGVIISLVIGGGASLLEAFCKEIIPLAINDHFWTLLVFSI